MHEVERYTLEAAFAVLEGAMGPPGALAAMTAKDVFAGYLVLDAWVANQDRHHANWAVLDSLSDPWEPRRLAPSFDHASSLGFQLSDRFRQRHLIPADLERWAAGGRCRTMYGRPGLLDLAVKAVETAGPSASWWKQGLEALDPDVLHVIVERVPAARLSQVSRMFITGLLDINRRRLLDAL